MQLERPLYDAARRQCIERMQAVISRLNTMAAIIGVQDSLQHVGPQLWFLQTLLGHATAVMHTFVQRSLRHASPHNPGPMLKSLSSHSQYASTTVLEPGRQMSMPSHLVSVLT